MTTIENKNLTSKEFIMEGRLCHYYFLIKKLAQILLILYLCDIYVITAIYFRIKFYL